MTKGGTLARLNRFLDKLIAETNCEAAFISNKNGLIMANRSKTDIEISPKAIAAMSSLINESGEKTYRRLNFAKPEVSAIFSKEFIIDITNIYIRDGKQEILVTKVTRNHNNKKGFFRRKKTIKLGISDALKRELVSLFT